MLSADSRFPRRRTMDVAIILSATVHAKAFPILDIIVVPLHRIWLEKLTISATCWAKNANLSGVPNIFALCLCLVYVPCLVLSMDTEFCHCDNRVFCFFFLLFFAVEIVFLTYALNLTRADYWVVDFHKSHFSSILKPPMTELIWVL